MAERRRESVEDRGSSAAAGDSDARSTDAGPRSPRGGAWPEPEPLRGRREGAGAWVEYALVRALAGVLAWLPRRARELSIELAAAVAHRLDRRRSDAARAFLRQAHRHARDLGLDGLEPGGAELDGAALERRVRQAWRHFLGVSVEGAGLARHVPRERAAERFEVAISPAARAVLEGRRGAVVVAPHLGSWEAFPVGFVAQGWGPLYAVVKLPKSGPLARWLVRLRERWGVRLVLRQGAMAIAPKVVARGGIVGLLMDQRARKRPVVVPFLGRAAASERGAAVLLKRLGAPVLVGACLRTAEPWRWRIEIPAVLEPEALRGLSLEAIVERIHAETERMILAHPDQYFWLHDRYRAASAPAVPPDSAAAADAR